MSKDRKSDVFGTSADGDERAQRIAALGHDIRAPLQVLGLSLQGLRLRARDAEDQELVFAAESAFEEVAAITDDLVDSLRLEVTSEPPREEGITLANLLHELERRFRRRAAEQKIALKTVKTRIHCVADRRVIQRILDNLVANALKHSKGTRVVVGARLRGYETLVLEVVDNGRGIPDDEQPFIFEEWYRGQAAIDSHARGQGLGLCIVKRFANARGGRVTVQSNLRRRTRFTVEIPTYAERRAPAAPLFDARGGVLSQKIIAILDDDDEILRSTRLSFESLGANVFSSTDELHFLAHVTSLPKMPDLVVLDFALGGRTAERTLKTLKTRFGTTLRVIIVSGHASDPELQALREQVTTLAKPLTTAHMDSIVELLTSGPTEHSIVL